jgi:hypothetical protein
MRDIMAPTVFRYKNYKFFFFSNEEPRMHIHILSPDGEAKFWIEPMVALANYRGFSAKQLNQLEKVVKDHVSEIIKAWQHHFQKA